MTWKSILLVLGVNLASWDTIYMFGVFSLWNKVHIIPKFLYANRCNSQYKTNRAMDRHIVHFNKLGLGFTV